MPTAPWLAGPPPRDYDPTEQYFECANCDTKVTRNDSDPCSGSDTCTARICAGCRQQCHGCGLVACGEHRGAFEGESTCHICIALYGSEVLGVTA